MSIAKFKRSSRIPGGVVQRVFRLPARLHHRGWSLGRHLLVLVHVGRRSGLLHTTVVEVVHRDPIRDEYVVMAAFGRGSDWYRNLQGNLSHRVIVGRRTFTAVHRELDDKDAALLLAEYEERRWWWGPILPWLVTQLVGWHYEPTPDARLRVVRERPMIAFSPHDSGSGADLRT